MMRMSASKAAVADLVLTLGFPGATHPSPFVNSILAGFQGVRQENALRAVAEAGCRGDGAFAN
jgi:hypothetical protein